MRPRMGKARPVLVGAAVLAAALAVELVDELADGAKSAALPLIRRDLGLSYGQIGLLESAPLLIGSIMELPLGVLAGHGRRRRRAVLLGGVLFVLTLIGAAAARSFAGLLVAFVLFFPASGAFVSLTQSGLMDADPAGESSTWRAGGWQARPGRWPAAAGDRRARGRWRVAVGVPGARGVRRGRVGGVARNPPGPVAADGREEDHRPWAAAVRRAPPTSPSPFTAARRPGVARWLVLLQVSDLLLDVFTGFLALYLVAVAHATPAQAALGVTIRLGAGLAGDAVLIRALRHARGLTLLRASAAVTAVVFPAFLLAGGLVPKLLLLGCLSMVTAPWYPVLQARLYDSLPDDSGAVVSLSSAAGLLGGAAPLAVGFVAQRFGLAWALAGLAIAPPLLLVGLRRSSGRPDEHGGAPAVR